MLVQPIEFALSEARNPQSASLRMLDEEIASLAMCIRTGGTAISTTKPRKLRLFARWAERDEERDVRAARLLALVEGLRRRVPWAEPIYVEGMGRILPPGSAVADAANVLGRRGEDFILAGGRRCRLELRMNARGQGLPNRLALELAPPLDETDDAWLPDLRDVVGKALAPDHIEVVDDALTANEAGTAPTIDRIAC